MPNYHTIIASSLPVIRLFIIHFKVSVEKLQREDVKSFTCLESLKTEASWIQAPSRETLSLEMSTKFRV